MAFGWKEHKNKINLADHGVDFADALHVFIDDNRIERRDVRFLYGEERWQTIGMTNHGVLFVVYTERDDGDLIHLISARKATKREKNAYLKGSFSSISNEA